mgnify:FL=1
MKSSDKQTAIAAPFANAADAHIAAGMLADHGIKCLLDNRTTNAIFPMGDTNPNFGVDIIVTASNLAEARKLLREHDDI